MTGRFVAPLLLIAVVLAMMLLHPSIPFANDGHCDPWYIFGMFYTFPSALHWFPGAYQVSRLTEILPGYLLTRILPGTAADYALFFISYSISVLAFYAAVSRLLTRQIAVFAGLFLALHPLMLGNYSATLDAPAVMWNIVNLYFVAAAMTCASPRRRYALLLASGVSLALALNAYVAIGILTTGNYVIYLVYRLNDRSLSASDKVRSLAGALLVTACGALAMLLVLGLVVVGFHGDFGEAFIQFNFLLSILSSFLKIGRGVGAVYWQSNWYQQGAITGMLALAGAASVLNLVRLHTAGAREHTDLRMKLLAVSAGVLFVEATLLVTNTAGFVLLQYDYYYVFFVPYLALAIFSALAFISSPSVKTVSATAVAFAIVGFLVNSFTNAQLMGVYADGVQSRAAIIAALLVVPLFAAAIMQKRLLTLGLVLVLGTLTILVQRPIQIGIQPWTESRPVEQGEADSYVRIREGLVFLQGISYSAAPSIFWIDPNPTFGTELVAYPRSYLQCGFWSFPSRPKDAAPLTAGEDVVVAAAPDRLMEKVTSALAAANVRGQAISRYEPDFKGARYEILVVRITGQIKPTTNALTGSSNRARVSLESRVPARCPRR